MPIVGLYCTFGRGLMHFFMDSATEAALESGMLFLRILSPFYFVVSTKLVSDGILPGNRQYAAVYGRHFYRPDSAGGAGIYPVCDSIGRHGYLVCMALGLDRRNRHVRDILSKGLDFPIRLYYKIPMHILMRHELRKQSAWEFFMHQHRLPHKG